MEKKECKEFQKVMADLIASDKPIDPEVRLLKHVRSCETCDDWMDEHLTEEIEDSRLLPLIAKLVKLDAESDYDDDLD